MREPGKLHDCAGPIHLIPKLSPHRIKLAGAAQKRGHKGQFGWNKNKKVNQLMLQNNCHFPLLSNLFSLPRNIYAKRYKNYTRPLWPCFPSTHARFFPRGGHFGIRCIINQFYIPALDLNLGQK